VDDNGSNYGSETDRHFGEEGKGEEEEIITLQEEIITLQEDAIASPTRPYDSNTCLKTGIHIKNNSFNLTKNIFSFSTKNY